MYSLLRQNLRRQKYVSFIIGSNNSTDKQSCFVFTLLTIRGISVSYNNDFPSQAKQNNEMLFEQFKNIGRIVHKVLLEPIHIKHDNVLLKSLL